MQLEVRSGNVDCCLNLARTVTIQIVRIFDNLGVSGFNFMRNYVLAIPNWPNVPRCSQSFAFSPGTIWFSWYYYYWSLMTYRGRRVKSTTHLSRPPPVSKSTQIRVNSTIRVKSATSRKSGVFLQKSVWKVEEKCCRRNIPFLDAPRGRKKKYWI